MKLNQLLNKTLEIEEQSELQSKIDRQLTSIFRNVPFYCQWIDYLEEGYCNENNPRCFNHLIGLPRNKAGGTNPLFDYQKELYDTLQSKKMIYVLKASGLGITEVMIRYIAWLCLRGDKLSNSDIAVITGPRLNTTVDIIDRMKALFYNISGHLPITFSTSKEVIKLNNVRIQAFPSDHLDDVRGIANASFLYCDEAAFFRTKDQEQLRDVLERYIIKSNPWIVLVSTPNKPDDIMERIMNEPNSLYHKLYFPYTKGLGKMWTAEEIELQKQSPSFQREYNLKFLGEIGDIFDPDVVEACIDDEYDLTTPNLYHPHWIGADPGYGSSEFAIVVVRFNRENMRLEVVHAESIPRALPTDAISHINRLVAKYAACKVFCDGSASGLIHELKHQYGEYIAYEKLKPLTLDRFIQSGCREPLVVPVNFQQHNREMMQHLIALVSKKVLRIHPKFDSLIIGLKSAKAKDDNYGLDKKSSPENDLLDALRLACLCVKGV